MSAIVGAAFGAAGQRCMALSVAVLVGQAGDWANDIAEGASKLKVNVPFFSMTNNECTAWWHGATATRRPPSCPLFAGSIAVVAVCRSFIPM